jgi:hypothetical protein
MKRQAKRQSGVFLGGAMRTVRTSAKHSYEPGARELPDRRPPGRYLAYMLPVAAAAWFIWRYGVNLPYLDDWMLAGALQEARTFGGFCRALFMGDTDHAILIPLLIFLPLARLTDWNVKVGMFAVLLSSIITFVAIVRLAVWEEPKTEGWSVGAALFISSLLMFSFVHYDTWLHDWQLTHDLSDMFAVIAIAFMSVSRAKPKVRLLVGWMLCLAASLCGLGGLAAWFAILPCAFALFPNTRRRLLICGACGVLAFLNWLFIQWAFVLYHFPTDWLFWLKHPWLGFQYFLDLLGAPLSQGGFAAPIALAPILGAVLVIVLLWSVGVIFWKPDCRSSATPWFALALFGLGVALMNTIGRGSFTPAIAATTSRYMVDSVVVAVAILQLARLTLTRTGFVTLAILFGLLSVLGSAAAFAPARHIREARRRAADCLVAAPYLTTRADNYEAGTLYPLCPLPGCVTKFRGHLSIAAALGLNGMSNRLAFVADPKVVYGEFASPNTDNKPLDLRGGEVVTASGWAAIPGQPAPKCVLVTDDSDDSKKGIMATSVSAHNSRATGLPAGDATSPKYRWSATIPSTFLDRGDSVLKAWVYDAKGHRFVQLLGEKRISTN